MINKKMIYVFISMAILNHQALGSSANSCMRCLEKLCLFSWCLGKNYSPQTEEELADILERSEEADTPIQWKQNFRPCKNSSPEQNPQGSPIGSPTTTNLPLRTIYPIPPSLVATTDPQSDSPFELIDTQQPTDLKKPAPKRFWRFW